MSEMPLFDRLQSQGHDDDERVFRVSEVNRAVRHTLEDHWGKVGCPARQGSRLFHAQ